MEQLLSVGKAAAYCGVRPATIRRWEKAGYICCDRINARGDRRFRRSELDVWLGRSARSSRTRREALYLRVSGQGDQLSSLSSQERTLRMTAKGDVVHVFKDVASGLKEERPGLTAALKSARRGEYDVLRVTHRDRLARFGVSYLQAALAAEGVNVEFEHEQEDQTPEQELVSDFMALVSSFAGRVYGQRSAAAKRRLLAEAEEQVKGG